VHPPTLPNVPGGAPWLVLGPRVLLVLRGHTCTRRPCQMYPAEPLGWSWTKGATRFERTYVHPPTLPNVPGGAPWLVLGPRVLLVLRGHTCTPRPLTLPLTPAFLPRRRENILRVTTTSPAGTVTEFKVGLLDVHTTGGPLLHTSVGSKLTVAELLNGLQALTKLCEPKAASAAGSGPTDSASRRRRRRSGRR
jgi:hypothetical protein